MGLPEGESFGLSDERILSNLQLPIPGFMGGNVVDMLSSGSEN